MCLYKKTGYYKAMVQRILMMKWILGQNRVNVMYAREQENDTRPWETAVTMDEKVNR